MNAALVKIENKKYRVIPEEDYLSLLHDIKDLKKNLKRHAEKLPEAMSKTDRRKIFKKSFGAFESKQSAEEIIKDIRNSRTFNRQTESF